MTNQDKPEPAAPPEQYRKLCEQIAPVIHGQMAGDVISMCCETLLWTICQSSENEERAHRRFAEVTMAMHAQIIAEFKNIKDSAKPKH
jgi:hypothetical protein